MLSPLSILRDSSESVDTSKPYVQSIANYQGTPSMANLSPNISLSLVKDTYSGKYYGSESYSQLKSTMDAARRAYDNQIKSNTNWFGGAQAAHMSMGGMVDPVGDAKAGLAKLDAFTMPAEGDYVQRPKMLESYNRDPAGWAKYFESSYKNPRQAESNASMRQQGQSSLSIAPASGNKKSRTTSTKGTGLSANNNLNPFGSLATGLGL